MSASTRHFLLTVPIGLFFISMASSAAATLIDRGGGLIYDNVLNVTWLQNANYGAGSSYDDGISSNDGRMTWTSAEAWAKNLDYDGYTGWRLPTVSPANGSNFVYGDLASHPSNSYDGLTDLGFNVSGPQSELGYMFYVNLGNTGFYDVAGNGQPNYSNVNSGPFTNLQQYFYWFGTEYDYRRSNFPDDPDFCKQSLRCSWDFVIGYGDQTIYGKDNEFYAWAVHDGDVANSVPEPSMLLLVGPALPLLWFLRDKESQWGSVSHGKTIARIAASESVGCKPATSLSP